MALWLKKDSTTWTEAQKVWVKTTSTQWAEAKKIWVKKTPTSWAVFWPQAGPFIETQTTIETDSIVYPATLTGTNYHWEAADTFQYIFQSSNDGNSWTNIGSYQTITNPAEGASNTKTYDLLETDFEPENPIKYFRFVVKATDTTNELTNLSESDPVQVEYAIPSGTVGSAVIARSSETSYLYSVTNPGTWSGNPTSYRYQWQQFVSSTWTDISGATSSSKDMTSFVGKSIRCKIWGINSDNVESTDPLISNELSVTYVAPGVSSFSVIGGTGAVTYSYSITSDDPARVITISYERLSGSNWSAWGSFTSAPSSVTNATSPYIAFGTYRFTLTVTNSDSTTFSSGPTGNIVVAPLTWSNLTLTDTTPSASALNASGLSIANKSGVYNVGVISWTNGSGADRADVVWSGASSGSAVLQGSPPGTSQEFVIEDSGSMSASVTNSVAGQATISWNQEGAQSYRLLYSVGQSGTLTLNANSTANSVSFVIPSNGSQISVTGLTVYSQPNQSGQEFSGSIVFPAPTPVTPTNRSGTTATVSATPTYTTITVPQAPGNLTRSTGVSGSKTFSWSTPLDNNSPILRYEYLVAGGSWLSNGLNTSITINFGTNVQSSFSVRAVNAVGEGAATSTGIFSIPAITSGPTASSITASSASIGWSSGFQSSYSLNLPTFGTFTGTTATSRSITGLSPNQQYAYDLTLTSSSGDTTASSASSFYTLTGNASVSITNVTSNGFTASWSSAGATSYFVDIYQSISGASIAGYPKIGTTLTTSGQLTGLSSGVSYTVQAWGINAAGAAGVQAVSSATPTAAPPPTCTPTCGSWSYTYGSWSAWSTCSGGSQTRSRTVSGTRTCTASNCSSYTENTSFTESETQSCTDPGGNTCTACPQYTATSSACANCTSCVNQGGFWDGSMCLI